MRYAAIGLGGSLWLIVTAMNAPAQGYHRRERKLAIHLAHDAFSPTQAS